MRGLLVGIVVGALFVPVLARAQPAPPSAIERARRPELGPEEMKACSFRHPVCVHAGRGAPGLVLLRVLASAERSWDALTLTLELPAPDVDISTGTFDLFLVDDPAAPNAELERRDPFARFDRASAVGLLDARTQGGCGFDAAVAKALARASLWRAAPATDETSARAEVAYVARLLVPCAMGAVDGVDVFQAQPGRALTDPMLGEPEALARSYASGAGLFYWWLDWTFGAQPGAIVRALWALSATRTPLGSSRWAAPSGFDVLRESFKGVLGAGSTLDDLLVEMAVARAFMGDADDGEHLPESQPLGAAGRVQREWEIPWPDAPRRFASGEGIAPTGSNYVAIDRDGAPPNAPLRVELTWEEHARMRWVAVKLDGRGRALGIVDIPSPDRGTSAQVSLVDLGSAASVLLVGTNLGDPFRPWTPGEVLEPHGWTLSIEGRMHE